MKNKYVWVLITKKPVNKEINTGYNSIIFIFILMRNIFTPVHDVMKVLHFRLVCLYGFNQKSTKLNYSFRRDKQL